MTGASSAFLTRSIILLALVLISMGTSMYFGRELGRDIMSLTKSNIEERFPDAGTSGTGEDDGFVLDLVSGRSSFDYDSESFGQNQFQREWADPEEEEFPTSADDPSVEISIIPVPENSEDQHPVNELADNREGESIEPGTNPMLENRTRGNIDWGLGDETTFRIQVGTYSERENAENVWHDLTTAGYDASFSTYTENDTVRYRVQVGTYHSRDEALVVADRIRSMGFDAWVFELQTD